MELPPYILHLAEATNWPSIQRRGLAPARDLIKASSLPATERDPLLRGQRRAHPLLPHSAEIRDQAPMPPAALEKCLVGLRRKDWYELINSRVFFWLDPDRLNRQRAACEPRPQIVLTIETADLVAAYRDRVALSPINSGSAMRRPARRGAATFVPLAEWRTSGWWSEAKGLNVPARKRSHPPAELTVLGALPDAMRFVVHTTTHGPGQRFEVQPIRAAAPR